MSGYLLLLRLAAPETIVMVAALAVLMIDLTTMQRLETRVRFSIAGMISSVGCVAAIAWMLALPAAAAAVGGLWSVDSTTQLVKIALLTLTIFTVLLSIDSDFTTHVGEYLALVLLASVGMMLLVSSTDLLMIFLSLELTSLSLYILAAFNKRDPKSAESSLKYFLFGGMSAAFTLFGLSLLYGLSGATNLRQIAEALHNQGSDPLLMVAIVMTVIGLGFKVAAVPFHLWAPDAYQGAPIPSAALIASGSKLASFFIFARIMTLGFPDLQGSGAWRNYAPGWVPVIAAIAALSMVLGNLGAIAQTSVRRLIAYSAIAHAGYMLLGVVAGTLNSLCALIYYAITYGLTTVGAFGVVAIVQRLTGGEKLADFAGLSRRAPLVSLCMLVFMLSLAGIPPLAGFFGKFYLFTTVLDVGAPSLGLLWLVILALSMSAVSLYYYLQVLKQIYVAGPPASRGAFNAPIVSQVALCLLAAAVILLGCAPSLLINKLIDATGAWPMILTAR